MDRSEFRQRLRVVGLSLSRFAYYIGVSRQTVTTWKSVPQYAVRIIELMEDLDYYRQRRP